MVLWQSAAAPPSPPITLTPLHDTSCDLQCDYVYELRMPQERVKYTMLGGSVVVVGISIASYDLMHASW